MEFTLDTINIEYEKTIISRVSRYWRTKGSIAKFLFVSDRFISKGILAQLKRNKSFLRYLKDSIIESIRDMSNEDFELIKAPINEYAANAYHKDKFVMKLIYWNETRDREASDDRPRICYQLSHEGFEQEIDTKEDLIRAAHRITSQDISAAAK